MDEQRAPHIHVPKSELTPEATTTARPPATTKAALPVVSVLMPIRNEQRAIRASLAAVLSQDWPAENLEVLVIDGRSSDGTRDAVRDVAAAFPHARVRLLDNPLGYVPHGLNIGLAAATGAYIARVDGHCMIASDHLRRCYERMLATKADNVGGLAFAVADGARAKAIAAAVSSPFGVGSARFRHRRPRPGWVDTAFPGFWRRETFELVGDFDEELIKNQDDEFNLRLIRTGGRIWLEPQLKTLYQCRSSLRGLWRQYYEYGLYKVRVAQKHGGTASLRHLVPSAFVIATVLSLIAAALTGLPWLAALVLGPYTLANGIATVAAICRERSLTVLPLVPVVFAVLHVAYGVGFLAGIWRWRHFGLPSWRPVRSTQ